MNEDDRRKCQSDRQVPIDPSAISTPLNVSEHFGKISLPARIMIAGPTMAGEKANFFCNIRKSVHN